jgi:hypothetical protein
MRSALGRSAAALIVDLGGGDVAVPEQLLDLADIDASLEQQGGAQRMGGIEALHGRAPIRTPDLVHGARQFHQVTLQQQIHRHWVHGAIR